MALFHKATVSPTKSELITQWLPTQSWAPTAPGSVDVIGSYRFDDPEGRVGMEAHLVDCGGTLLHVPLTYRDEPFEGPDSAFVGNMEHSALGTRWVYDGLGDPRFILMLAAVAMTGQGEALGMVKYDGEWVVAPSNVRIVGGGWPTERLSVDGLIGNVGDAATVEFRNERFDMVVHRRPEPGSQPAVGLTASWEGCPDSVVLAEIQQR